MFAGLWDNELDAVTLVDGGELKGLVHQVCRKDSRCGGYDANPDQFRTAVSEAGTTVVCENLDVVRIPGMQAAS